MAEQTGKNLGQRYENFMEEKNAFRNLNGLTAMSENIEDTLEKLTAAVQPATANLPLIIRESVLKYGVEGLTLETMWKDKLAEGANIVAVVDGVFGFYKDKEKLPDPTRILRVPVLPPIYDLRKQERFVVLGQIKLQLEELKKEIKK